MYLIGAFLAATALERTPKVRVKRAMRRRIVSFGFLAVMARYIIEFEFHLYAVLLPCNQECITGTWTRNNKNCT